MNQREAKALVFKGLFILLDSDNGWLEAGSDADNQRMLVAFNEVMRR